MKHKADNICDSVFSSKREQYTHTQKEQNKYGKIAAGISNSFFIVYSFRNKAINLAFFYHFSFIEFNEKGIILLIKALCAYADVGVAQKLIRLNQHF